MKNNQEIKLFLDSLGIEYLDIKPPINSDIYCIELYNESWGAMRIGQEQPIVDFGKYRYLFGFDGEYCLVNTEGRSNHLHNDRGIINSKGVEVIAPYTCEDIFDFYGNDFPFTIHRDGWEIKYDRQNIALELSRTKLNNK